MWLVWLIVGLWLVGVIGPMVLCAIGKVSYRWILMWEAIMFFPFIFAFLLTKGPGLNMNRVRELYIPKGR